MYGHKQRDEHEGLTIKERTFCELLIQGKTQAKAYKEAGYKVQCDAHAKYCARKLLTKDDVWKYYQSLKRILSRPDIADGIERQVHLTSFIRDEGLPPETRMRAIDLLAKAQGDYIQRIDMTVTPTVISDDIIDITPPTKNGKCVQLVDKSNPRYKNSR